MKNYFSSLSNETKVAVTIAVSILVAFLGFRYMSDMPIFRQSQRIYTHFDKVDGLNPGSYIYINGVKVGSVKRIDLVNGDSVQVMMTFDVGVDIPKDSKALLQSSGLLDEKNIVIERGDSPENIPYDGHIKGVYEGGMLETLKNEGRQLSDDVSQSFGKLNTLLEKLNTMISEDNQSNVNQVLDDLRKTSGEISDLLENKRSELASSIDHANRFLANIDTISTANKERVDSVLTGMERSLNEIETLSSELNKSAGSLNTILARIEKGEGTLGQLVNNPSLYNNVDSLSAEIRQLVKNINEDPRKYLRHMKLIEVF